MLSFVQVWCLTSSVLIESCHHFHMVLKLLQDALECVALNLLHTYFSLQDFLFIQSGRGLLAFLCWLISLHWLHLVAYTSLSCGRKCQCIYHITHFLIWDKEFWSKGRLLRQHHVLSTPATTGGLTSPSTTAYLQVYSGKCHLNRDAPESWPQCNLGHL